MSAFFPSQQTGGRRKEGSKEAKNFHQPNKQKKKTKKKQHFFILLCINSTVKLEEKSPKTSQNFNKTSHRSNINIFPKIP